MNFKFTQDDRFNELHPDIIKYMNVFVENRIASFQKLKSSVELEDIAGIRDFCHNNLGVAGSYKCFKLEEITLYVQSMARANDLESIVRIIPSFEAYLQELKAKI